MVKHIVCFKLNQGEDIDYAVNLLKSMKGKVESVIDLEVGKDFLKSPRSFDIILQVTLKDKPTLEVYQNDDYHVNVIKKHMHKATEKSVAVDYEF